MTEFAFAIAECDCCKRGGVIKIEEKDAYRGQWLGRCPSCPGDVMCRGAIQEGLLMIWQEELECGRGRKRRKRKSQ